MATFYTKRMASRVMQCLLMTGGLLFISSHCAILSTQAFSAHLDSTISSASTGTSYSKKPPVSEESGSTDSLAALMEANYLESIDPIEQSANANVHQAQRADEISENSLAHLKSTLAKSRKKAENQIKAANWWSSLASKADKSRSTGDMKNKWRAPNSQPAAPPSVYKEQPLSQNPILTLRNQLMALRDKHRLLMKKAVPQLIQLDQKLVDSYRMCLKRKMPLYAGMLYRTRDFVVRMANEVKRERQILETMAKQMQQDLRLKLTNRTLVKEYNRLAPIRLTVPQVAAQATPPQQRSWSLYDAPADYKEAAAAAGRRSSSASLAPFLTTNSHESISSSLDVLSAGSPSQTRLNKVKEASDETSGRAGQLRLARAISGAESPTTASFFKTPGGFDKIGATHQKRVGVKKLPTEEANSFPSTIRTNVESNQVSNEDVKGKALQQGREPDEPSAARWQQTSPTSQTTSGLSASSTLKHKQRTTTYTVHINEVKLKQELINTQTLIDRINSSSVDLIGVVDDIIYLFKLTSAEPSRKGLTISGKTSKYEKMHAASNSMDTLNNGIDHKRAKGILESPFKAFFERYERLSNQAPKNVASAEVAATSQTRAADFGVERSSGRSDTNMIASSASDVDPQPELKPLFDSASIETYTDPVDLELGFEVPAVIET